MRSFSLSDGIRPTKLSTLWTPRTKELLLSLVGSSANQPPGSWNTTTSPRSGSAPNHGVSLSTRTRSPTWSVFCIDSDGMENAWTKNVLITSASTRAMPMRIGSSFQNDRGLRSFRSGCSSVPSAGSALSGVGFEASFVPSPCSSADWAAASSAEAEGAAASADRAARPPEPSGSPAPERAPITKSPTTSPPCCADACASALTVPHSGHHVPRSGAPAGTAPLGGCPTPAQPSGAARRNGRTQHFSITPGHPARGPTRAFRPSTGPAGPTAWVVPPGGRRAEGCPTHP